jgi:hypothetical protein
LIYTWYIRSALLIHRFNSELRSREKVVTYTAVGAVCTTSLLGCLVDLDVLDDQVSGIEALCVGVGFGVLEEREEEFGGFNGPAGFGNTKCFPYRHPIVSN